MVIEIATTFIVLGIGTGILFSKRKFSKSISEIEFRTSSLASIDNKLLSELDRFEQLKINLIEVKKNIELLDIPIPETLNNYDTTESSLNKLSLFFEKYSRSSVGTEAFILSILPISQTGESLCSFASMMPGEISKAFEESVSALRNGALIPGIDDINECLGKFCDGMLNISPHSIAHAIDHNNYFDVLLKPIKGGMMEMTGINDAVETFSDSMHDMASSLSLSVEANLDPTDFTDLDFSGHIPILTIAISSFREFNLLVDNKTDTITSLKNVCLDAIGAGGGGLVGTKAGALVGSIFGPIGTLVGGVVGAVGGAIGGRTITNSIKQRPLRNAIEEYQSGVTCMKDEASNKARNMLDCISNYTIEKRKAFKEDELLKEIPVIINEEVILSIALIIYNSIYNYVDSLKRNIHYIKSSLWYSEKKYGNIISDYETNISEIENQLPFVNDINANPKLALQVLIDLKMPLEKSEPVYIKKIQECSNELKAMNDKNNSSILLWSYMINGLYNKTLNEIAEFSNTQLKDFNQFMSFWKEKILTLEKNVNKEKEKLGLK